MEEYLASAARVADEHAISGSGSTIVLARAATGRAKSSSAAILEPGCFPARLSPAIPTGFGPDPNGGSP